MEDRSYIEANRHVRERLRDLVEGLDEDSLATHVNEYWSVAGVLAHMAWWDARAEFIKAFEDEAQNHDNYIILTNYDTPQRLETLTDREVVVLGAISEVRLGDGNAPTRVMLSRRRTNDFPLIFWDRDVFLSSGVQKRVGEYVRVKGFVTKYEDKRGRRYQMQIKVDVPSQIQAAAEKDEKTL